MIELEPVKRKGEIIITEFESGTLQMDGFDTLNITMKFWLLDRIIKDIKRKNLNDDAAKNLLDMFVNNAEQYNKYLNYYKRRKVHNEKR